jgi:hypothetical protein
MTRSEMEQRAKRMRGLPVLDAHTDQTEAQANAGDVAGALGKRRIGQVLGAHIDDRDRLRVLIQLNSDERGAATYRRVQSGDWRGLSLGWHVFHDKDFTRLYGKRMVECSIVNEGAMPGTDITAYADTDSPTFEMLRRRHMGGAAADAANSTPPSTEAASAQRSEQPADRTATPPSKAAAASASHDDIQGALRFLKELRPFTNQTSHLTVVTASADSQTTPQQFDALMEAAQQQQQPPAAAADPIDAMTPEQAKEALRQIQQAQLQQQQQQAATPTGQMEAALQAMVERVRTGQASAAEMSDVVRQAMSTPDQHTAPRAGEMTNELLAEMQAMNQDRQRTEQLKTVEDQRAAAAERMKQLQHEQMPGLVEAQSQEMQTLKQQLAAMTAQQQQQTQFMERMQQLQQQQFEQLQQQQQQAKAEAEAGARMAEQQKQQAAAADDMEVAPAAADDESTLTGKRAAAESNDELREQIREQMRKEMAEEMRAKLEALPADVAGSEQFKQFAATLPGLIERNDMNGVAMTVSANSRMQQQTLQRLDAQFKQAELQQKEAELRAMRAKISEMESKQRAVVGAFASQGAANQQRAIQLPAGYIDPLAYQKARLEQLQRDMGEAVADPSDPSLKDMADDIPGTFGAYVERATRKLREDESMGKDERSFVASLASGARPLAPVMHNIHAEPNMGNESLKFIQAKGLTSGWTSAKAAPEDHYDLNTVDGKKHYKDATMRGVGF